MERGALPRIRTFRDLVAWQKSIDLVRLVYQQTGSFPDREQFGLVAQMRRAAVSVPANIAEGYGRGRKLDYLRFLRMARGSLFELMSHAEVAKQLSWLDGQGMRAFEGSSAEVDRLLSGLLRALMQAKAKD
jgi:four helix bundle protein